MEKVISIKELKRKKISFLLITATKIEKNAVLKVMRPLEGEKTLLKAVGKNLSYDVGVLGRYTVAHVICENQGSIKEGAAILTTQEAISALNPKACVMIGIAYGADKQSQKLGDVLISEEIQPYDSIKVATDENGQKYIEDRNEIKIPGMAIRNQFTNFDFEGRKFNIWCGTILSGEKLIDNENYKKDLIERFTVCKDSDKNIIGGEMEGVGLASTLANADNLNWIVVKAICDWADGNKKEKKNERQQFAAHNAVEFCEKLFNTDMLAQINGIKPIKVDNNTKKLEIVNGYVLYYYRSMYTLSFRKLSEITKISEDELRKYENLAEEHGEKTFCKTPLSNIQKLRTALSCDEAISSENTDKKIIKFYDNYKNTGRFYPVNAVKAVVFDFDGTLTKTENNYSTWQLIWLYLGYSLDDCGRFHRKYVNHELTHQEWCDITAKYFINKNLTATGVEEVSKNIKLIDGTIDTIKKIKEKGVKIYICSGSINDVIDNVLGDSKMMFDDIACNQFSYDKNRKLSAIKGTEFDFEGKASYVTKIIEENGILPEECLFVGNSDNDVWAYQSGVKTLVVNPHKITGMDRTVWKYYMEEMTDLHQILPFIFPHDV